MPKVSSQAKAFTYVQFRYDSSLPISTAVCRFNNSDRDHDSIGSVWMESANDRSNDMDSHWDKYEEIELYNDRVDKFFPDSNSTKAE